MSTKVLDPESVDNSEITRVVRSGEPSGNLTRMRAISALRSIDGPDVGVLGDLLVQRRVKRRFKQLTVTALTQIGSSEAIDRLRGAVSKIDDPRLLGNVASGLGRIGDRDSLEEVERISERTEDYPHQQATFAASVLTYRFGLEGHEITRPSAEQRVRPSSDDRTGEIAMNEASSEEVELAVQTLGPTGVRLTDQNALLIECGEHTFLFLWNEAFAGRIGQLRDQKGIVGVLGRKNRFEDEYALSLLIMATPSNAQEVSLTLHKPDGRLLYAGTLKPEGEESGFEIQSVRQSGIAPVEIRGTISEGSLQIDESVSTLSIPEQKRPKPL